MSMTEPTEEQIREREEREAQTRLSLEKKEAILNALSKEYEARLNDQMANLHNQFVAFIAAANVPLPQTLLVLQMLVQETIEQAYKKYLGG